jgi:ligand-binding SRPBCC domain-containing protein
MGGGHVRIVDLGGGSQLLEAAQWLPAAPDRLFAFFADAHNLERITPAWLRFGMLTPEPIDIQLGAEIDYRLRLHGVPLRWRSRIVLWQPPRRFADRQVSGPYARWVHLHALHPRRGGTLARDRVAFRLPGGTLGRALGGRLAERDLRRIFAFRAARLAELAAELADQR